jgi:hypothetical protein
VSVHLGVGLVDLFLQREDPLPGTFLILPHLSLQS